jgi:Ca2+-binding RTX toxin-like protein
MSTSTLIAALAAPLASARLPGVAAAAGGPGFGYDDARSHTFHNPSRAAATEDGGFLLSEIHGHGPVYRYDPDSHHLALVAGGGAGEVSDRPKPATGVSLFGPTDLAPTSDGGFLVSVSADGYVARVAPNGTITKAVEQGDPGFLATLENGDFLYSDYLGFKIRRTTPSGETSTAAGAADFGISPDGSAEPGSPIGYPLGVAGTGDGGYVFSEFAGGYSAIRRVSPQGELTTLAGGQPDRTRGDGGPAVDARLGVAVDVAVDADGNVLFIDGARIREIFTDGTIDTVAGTGHREYDDDGIAGTDANLAGPQSITVTPDGGFLILDGDGRVRKVTPGGIIHTIAGIPSPEFCEADPYNGIQGGSEPEEIHGDKLRDLIRGEDGDDLLVGRGERDCLVGGFGDDRLEGGPKSDALLGDNGADVLVGANGDDYMVAEGDQDTLEGGGGEDRMYGGFDDDRLEGGDGKDFLYGDTGRDTLIGGTGNDFVDAQGNERESYGGPSDIVRCGPGRDTVKANTYDRVSRSCEIRKGAIGD